MTFTEGPDATGLAIRLQAALPGTTVTARPAGGALLRRFRSAAAQVRDLAVLDVWFPSHDLGIAVRLPDRPDLDLGRVAEILRTTADVRRAFGRAASHLTDISFDQASRSFRSNRYSGSADLNLGHTHINANFVLSDGPRGRNTPAATAAHEAWHQIEHAFEMQRFADSMELRRQLGEHFGVETLERVLTGNRPNAKPEQRAALARLRAEVSDYATTNTKEATAEMMRRWWCDPPPQPAIAVLFGRLMTQFFGVQRP